MFEKKSKHLNQRTQERKTPGLAFLLLGAFLIILSGIAFVNIGLTTIFTIYYFGILMIAGGVAQLIHGIHVYRWKYFIFWFISGLLYTILGSICFINPILAASVLTFSLALTLIFAGLSRSFIIWNSKNVLGWIWIFISGIITIAAGVVILIGWPSDSLSTLGLFLAFDLLVHGIGLLLFGFGLRQP